MAECWYPEPGNESGLGVGEIARAVELAMLDIKQLDLVHSTERLKGERG